MLSVTLAFSIWWVMLALIPLAVLILALSLVLPHTGPVHNAFQNFVSAILFMPLPFAPNLTFIQLSLGGLGVVAAFLGYAVWNNDLSKAVLKAMPLDKQLLAQARGWREQRNFYLTCLALLLWWTVYIIFTYKKKIAALYETIDELQQQGGRPGAGAAGNKRGGSDSAASKPAPTKEGDEHEVAAPKSGSSKKKE